MPFRGPVRLLAAVPEPHATIGVLAVGALAGLVFAVLVATDLAKFGIVVREEQQRQFWRATR
jgi:hypothetical protein